MLHRPQMTIWHMCIACWIPKATNTHSEYVVFIAFLLQLWLHNHAWMLYAHYLSCLCVNMITILFYKMFIVFYPVKIVYCGLFHILLSVTHGSMECIYILMCWHWSICPTMPSFLSWYRRHWCQVSRQEVTTCFMSTSTSNCLPARGPKKR